MKRRSIRTNLVFINSLLFFMILGLQIWKTEENRGRETTAGKAVNETEEVKPKIALTFDDGPHSVYTPMLLKGLRQRRVEATFFLIGKNIEGNEEIVKQMDEQGHLIGNHTYHHVKVDQMSEEEACREMMMTSDAVEAITGEATCYIRPPFGLWNESVDCGIDMISVMWTVDPRDWTTKNVEQVVNQVVTQTKENDIILLHDCYESSVEAAFQIVDQLEARGFEFVTVDELILE